MSLAKPQQVPHFITSSPLPEMGLRALPVSITFSNTVTSYTDDLSWENEQGTISGVQTIWVDNSTNPCPITITFNETKQAIDVPAYAQGYWPVMCHQNVNYTVALYGAPSAFYGNFTVQVTFLNVVVSPDYWITQNFITNVQTVANAGNTAINVNVANPGGKTGFITGFDITGTGATAAGTVQATITSVQNTIIGGATTLTYTIPVPILPGAVYFSERFNPPLQIANGANLALTVPAMGGGQTAAQAQLYYYWR